MIHLNRTQGIYDDLDQDLCSWYGWTMNIDPNHHSNPLWREQKGIPRASTQSHMVLIEPVRGWPHCKQLEKYCRGDHPLKWFIYASAKHEMIEGMLWIRHVRRPCHRWHLKQFPLRFARPRTTTEAKRYKSFHCSGGKNINQPDITRFRGTMGYLICRQSRLEQWISGRSELFSFAGDETWWSWSTNTEEVETTKQVCVYPVVNSQFAIEYHHFE